MAVARTARRLHPLLMAGVVALCAGTLAACAANSPTTPSATTGGSLPATTGGSLPAASKSAAGPSGEVGESTTLTGTVSAGVESGCVVLVGADGSIQANLIGLDIAVAPVGSSIKVTGTFEKDMMTTCQQGDPFTVTDVQVS